MSGVPQVRSIRDVPPPKKGKNYHEYDGVRYEFDEPYDELYWEEITQTGGAIHHRVWHYYQGIVPCPACQRTDDTVFYIERTGVFMKCKWCEVTIPVPPMDIETKESWAELVEDKVVTPEEATAICNRVAQMIPSSALTRGARPPRPKTSKS